VLYITLDKWSRFLLEADYRLFQPDLEDQNVDVITPLRRIALPEALLTSNDAISMLPELLQYFFNVGVLFIVIDAQPSMHVGQSISNDDDIRLQPRWELEDTQGGAFVWNQNYRRFDFSGYSSNKAQCKLIEEAIKGLGEAIVQWEIDSFEVRPVYAIPR
jgi:hypothetical protein